MFITIKILYRFSITPRAYFCIPEAALRAPVSSSPPQSLSVRCTSRFACCAMFARIMKLRTLGSIINQKIAKKYTVTFGLPDSIKISAEVVGIKVAGAEVSIEMNVVSKGDFAMAYTKDGGLIMTLAYPLFSKEVDFEEQNRQNKIQPLIIRT